MDFIFNVSRIPRWASAACCAALLIPVAVDARERAELVMGSVARVDLVEGSTDAGVFDAAFAAFRDVDRAMSLYRPESELVRVNTGAYDAPQAVTPALATVLARAQAIQAATDGAFDVTVLPLLRAFGAYAELDWLAPVDAAGADAGGLVVDAHAGTVRFLRRGMGVDLGGIAKGFALDRARDALVARGVTEARLDLGGNLAFIGRGPAGAWRVAVRDPDAPEEPLGMLALAPNATVSTSANYFRDFDAEGWRAPTHIYDPRDGRPVTRALAVTVWGPDATTADALSTALLVLGPERAGVVLARFPDAGALVVDGRGPTRRLVLAGAPPLGFEGPRLRTPTLARLASPGEG